MATLQNANYKTETATQQRSSRGRLPSGKPNPIDVHVGRRLRQRRTILGLTQESLADLVGLTFQQVQKYEHGTNRIGASRLWDLSQALGASVSFFFEDMADEAASASPRNVSVETHDLPAETSELLPMRETLELMRAYYGIKDVKVRQRFYDMTKSFAAMGANALDSSAGH